MFIYITILVAVIQCCNNRLGKMIITILYWNDLINSTLKNSVIHGVSYSKRFLCFIHEF